MAMLNQHDLFQRIHLRFSEGTVIQDQTMRKFELEMVLNQNASLKRLDPEQDLAMDPMGDTIQINNEGERVISTPQPVPALNPANGKDR
jgi:hypothetical protein